METALEIGRRAALIKLAEGVMGRGGGFARPASTPQPAAPARPPVAMNVSMRVPAQRRVQPSAGMGGFGQAVGNFFRDPANMGRLIGGMGSLGQGLVGAGGAPGLFALSNLPRGFGEMGSILKGGIPTGDAAHQQ